MFKLGGFLLLVISLFAMPALAQTSPPPPPNPVPIDSTLRNPDAKKDPLFLPKKDTTVNLKVQGQAKSEPKIFKDSARLAIEKMPRQAARRSALLPGLGQVKNGHWWKVPFIYGGFVGVGLMLDFNQRYYKQALTELQFRDANNGEIQNEDLKTVDTQGLIRYKDFYRRNRDFAVLLGLGAYTINIIDAYVSAKFFRFDISDDLGIRIKPSAIPSVSNAYVFVPAIKIQLSL